MMGFNEMAGDLIVEGRTGKNIRHRITGLLRQSVFARLAGYEDTNDHKGLSRDPAMRAVLRPGNVHSADGWREFLSPIVEKYGEMGKKLYLRGDAAFASPDVYEYLEEKGILYAIRLKANNNLYREIEHLMTRPVGRHSQKPKVFYHAFYYRAGAAESS